MLKAPSLSRLKWRDLKTRLPELAEFALAVVESYRSGSPGRESAISGISRHASWPELKYSDRYDVDSFDFLKKQAVDAPRLRARVPVEAIDGWWVDVAARLRRRGWAATLTGGTYVCDDCASSVPAITLERIVKSDGNSVKEISRQAQREPRRSAETKRRPGRKTEKS